MQGQPGTIESMGPGECVPLSAGERFNYTLRGEGTTCPPGSHAIMAVRTPGAHFQIDADQVHEVEWHGFQTHCPNQDKCPSGGVRERNPIAGPTPQPANATIFTERYGYTNLKSESMSFHGNGTAYLIMAGGPSPTIEVDGWIRLPSFESSCESCKNANQTFFASGNILLENLSYQPNGRVSGNLSGDIQTARLDETLIDPAALGLSVGGVVVAAGAVAVVWKFLAWLFTRNVDVLGHPKRRHILETIQEQPGIHFRELGRATGLGPANLRHHVERLTLEGLVVRRKHLNTLRYFENHGRYGPEWQALALLRDPDLVRIHAYVGAHAGLTQKELIRIAQSAWGWNQRTAYRRVLKLRRAGLLVDSDGSLEALGVESCATLDAGRRAPSRRHRMSES